MYWYCTSIGPSIKLYCTRMIFDHLYSTDYMSFFFGHILYV